MHDVQRRTITKCILRSGRVATNSRLGIGYRLAVDHSGVVRIRGCLSVGVNSDPSARECSLDFPPHYRALLGEARVVRRQKWCRVGVGHETQVVGAERQIPGIRGHCLHFIVRVLDPSGNEISTIVRVEVLDELVRAVTDNRRARTLEGCGFAGVGALLAPRREGRDSVLGSVGRDVPCLLCVGLVLARKGADDPRDLIGNVVDLPAVNLSDLGIAAKVDGADIAVAPAS